MRRNIRILFVMAVAFMITLPSMTQKTSYLYRNDGIVNQYIISKVQSICSRMSMLGFTG